MAIVVGVWIYVASAGGMGGAPGERHLLPFQKLMADRAPEEQRMFRELQEGLLEAEARRSSAGAWPTPAALASDGVPPFAFDPTRRSSVVWQFIQSGTMVNYLGIPKNASESAWLVLVQEPAPGVPPDQTFEDEEHHRLTDGAMLHVSAWLHASGSTVLPRIIRMPQAEGWTQLYAVGPSAAPTAPAAR
ncbi:MAG TPA: hypothetical protein VLW55_21980 [Burkholderiaceae bacterium]|nr:hypothetical protein [Burkholderiaceae bacterium]